MSFLFTEFSESNKTSFYAIKYKYANQKGDGLIEY